jgi:hypothetical protein
MNRSGTAEFVESRRKVDWHFYTVDNHLVMVC